MKSGQGAEVFDEKGQEACDGNKKCGGKAESGRKAQKGKFFGEVSGRWLQNTSRRQIKTRLTHTIPVRMNRVLLFINRKFAANA